jgi:hypothetical protein
MTFEPGPANPQPFSAGIHTAPQFDVIELLPHAAAERLRQLRQHAADLHALTVPFEDIREASEARTAAAQRLTRLLAPRSENGFNLDPTDARVIEQQKLVDKLNDDFQRLNERNETRSAAWRTASQTLSAVETWPRNGRPHGTTLLDYDGPEPVLAKGENGLLDAISNRRRRVREIKATLHRIGSAPYPSAHAKTQMRAQIEALAMLGAPDVSNLIEHDRQIVWPTQRVQSQVVGTATPSLAFAEMDAAIPLLVWLNKDALIKRLDAKIDAEADPKAALSHEARQQQEAEVMGDLLACERDEAALVWQAQSQNLPVEHRGDINPVALLGVRIVTAPAVNRQGTSPMHAYDIVGGGGDEGPCGPGRLAACFLPGIAQGARAFRPRRAAIGIAD